MSQVGMPCRCRGFSMVELMVALVLGLLLTAAVLQTFVSLKRTYEFQQAFSRIQENGRFAIELLARDIRQAGFFGCLTKEFEASEVENHLNSPASVGWNMVALAGDNDVSSAYSTYANVVEGTDVIAIQTLSDDSVALVEPYSNSAQMFVDPSFNDDCPSGSLSDECHEGEILMVTDCSQATLFQLTQSQATGGGGTPSVNLVHSGSNTYSPGNQSPSPFENEYEEGSFISRLMSYAYYIRENTAGVPSLYRSRLAVTGMTTASVTAEELVEGVEDMQILYGEDTDGDGAPNYYVPSDAVTDMEDVVSVDISLLLRSINDNLANSSQSLGYNGGTYNATDKRIRKVFSTKIALRNRLD